MTENPYSSPDSKDDSPAPVKKPFFNRQRILEWAAVAVVLAVLVAMLLPARRQVREPARRTQCKNNLKQILLALYNYHDQYGSFPPACTVDAQGQPLHSWRTLILPWVDQQPLYNSIDLSKPWDDPANAVAHKTPLAAYHCPSDPNEASLTTYHAIVGPGAAFEIGGTRKIKDFKDGTANTLLIVEVDPSKAVHWMSPVDHGHEFLMTVQPDSKLIHTSGAHVGLADGAVRFMITTTDPKKREALISIAGGETVGDW